MATTPNTEVVERVGFNLNQVILAFWKQKTDAGKVTPEGNRFTATELRQYVQHHNFGTAPASADRVMRNLKKSNKINYAVVNRIKSLYAALPLDEVKAV